MMNTDHIQKLKLVDRRFPALLNGEKIDTIRWNEGSVDIGLLEYEGCDDTSLTATVLVEDVLFVKLCDVPKYIDDGKTPNDHLETMRNHYPMITLDTEIMLVKHLTPEETAKLDFFAFGDNGDMADELLNLVLEGVKTATCSALQGYRDSIPQVGDKSVVLDRMGQPRCMIENIAVNIVQFNDVNADFAYKEGEGDRTLDHWRKIHQEFFEKQGVFNPEMALVCEEFKILKVYHGS